MDKETAKYIVEYFSDLLSGKEKLAINYVMSTSQVGSLNPDFYPVTNIYKKMGWLNPDQTVLDLLKDGYDNFEIRVADRILTEHGEKVFLNKCGKCDKLARTPLAKQCRFCGNSWREG